jgi:hypothetical protein
MVEIAAEDDAEISRLMAAMLRDVPRPSATDQIVAEALAVATIRARRARRAGRRDSQYRREIAALMRAYPTAAFMRPSSPAAPSMAMEPEAESAQ